MAGLSKKRPGWITWSKGISRGILAFVFTFYSVAKFTGAQFTVFGMTLDKPLAEVAGTELTWAFFGYSQLYATFIALGQLVAAFLLAFNRTARLGAAVLLPITANIVMVNFGLNFPPDTKVLSLMLLGINLFLLLVEFPEWKRFIWVETAADPVGQTILGIPRMEILRGLLLTLFLLIVSCGLIFAARNLNHKTAIVGDWLVESATVNGKPTTDPALGGDWRWVSFDPFGYMNIRTNRWTFIGKYTAPPGSDQFSANYDPVSLPPLLIGNNLPHPRISAQDEKRLVEWNSPDYKWPVSLKGTFGREGKTLVIRLLKEKDEIEWKLIPYVRPKW